MPRVRVLGARPGRDGARRGRAATPAFEKEAWVSATLLDWGSCGHGRATSTTLPAGYALYALPALAAVGAFLLGLLAPRRRLPATPVPTYVAPPPAEDTTVTVWPEAVPARPAVPTRS